MTYHTANVLQRKEHVAVNTFLVLYAVKTLYKPVDSSQDHQTELMFLLLLLMSHIHLKQQIGDHIQPLIRLIIEILTQLHSQQNSKNPHDFYNLQNLHNTERSMQPFWSVQTHHLLCHLLVR